MTQQHSQIINDLRIRIIGLLKGRRYVSKSRLQAQISELTPLTVNSQLVTSGDLVRYLEIDGYIEQSKQRKSQWIIIRNRPHDRQTPPSLSFLNPLPLAVELLDKYKLYNESDVTLKLLFVSVWGGAAPVLRILRELRNTNIIGSSSSCGSRHVINHVALKEYQDSIELQAKRDLQSITVGAPCMSSNDAERGSMPHKGYEKKIDDHAVWLSTAVIVVCMIFLALVG